MKKGYRPARTSRGYRSLFLVLAARSGAGVAGSELLQRREWPRGVVLGLSRGRDHYAVLAAAHGAASAETEPQQRLQAVQHNASGLSGAMRRLAGLCDGAEPWDRGAQSARLPAAESVWLAKSARPSLQSGRRPTVRNTIAAPVGALDADCRAWREGLQSRGRWSTPRRARAASAAQQAWCMGGRSIAFRRPTLIDDYRRFL